MVVIILVTVPGGFYPDPDQTFENNTGSGSDHKKDPALTHGTIPDPPLFLPNKINLIHFPKVKKN